jgi:hypothetical protein
MKCPKCNHNPISFIRFFQWYGNDSRKAIQKIMICEKCNSFLQIQPRWLGFRFWTPTLFFLILFIIEVIELKLIVHFLGLIFTIVLSVSTMYATIILGSFIEWKYFKLEEVEKR